MSLYAAISDALDLVNRDTQTSAVHDVVRNALRDVAPGIDVRTTDYFTHTFIPDLIMRWGSNDHREERHVHLRFVVSDDAFQDEVDYVATTEPIFIGLSIPRRSQRILHMETTASRNGGGHSSRSRLRSTPSMRASQLTAGPLLLRGRSREEAAALWTASARRYS